MAINRTSYYRDALPPQPISGSSVVHGPTFDKSNAGNTPAESLDLVVQSYDIAGGPSAVSVVATLMDSDDGATFAVVNDIYGDPLPTIDVTAVGPPLSLPVDARSLREYWRTDFLPTFTGGTSPSITLSAMYHMSQPLTAPPLP